MVWELINWAKARFKIHPVCLEIIELYQLSISLFDQLTISFLPGVTLF